MVSTTTKAPITGRKIEAEKRQRRANEYAIDQTYQQLSAKIGGDVRN